MGAVLRNVSWYDMLAILRVLELRQVRAINLFLALPLAALGRWLLPPEIPAGGLPELIKTDLGRVAAGLFLSFAGTLAALAFSLGSFSTVARYGDRIRPRDSVAAIVTSIALLAVCLYLAGRAFSWVGAISILLVAGGAVWSINQWIKPSGGPPAGDMRPAVYDPNQD